LKYNWKQFDRDTNKLVKKIKKDKFRPKTIIALARGGLILGVKLSHKLDCPLMIVSCKTYSEAKKSLDTVLLNTSYTVPLQSPVLICDEMVDSGKTLKVIVDHFKSLSINIRTATLLYKPHSIIKPDYYIEEVNNKCWVNFCWER
jgi:hypoxanthine phosphoribosyltransferase